MSEGLVLTLDSLQSRGEQAVVVVEINIWLQFEVPSLDRR